VTIWHLDPATVSGGGTGFDPSQPLDFLLMVSPDGTVWSMSVDDTGAWATNGDQVRLTEAGDVRLTQDGLPRTISGA
jgi:hypothetical protein